MTIRKQIRFGVPFTISVNNYREQEFEVLNFHDQKFDQPVCTIKNTTSYPPPTAYVTDAANGVIKLVFHEKTPYSASLELLVQAGVAQKVEVTETKVLLDGEAAKEKAKQVAAGTWTTLKKAFWGFVIVSLIFWFVKGSTFGDWIISVWSKINAAQIIQMADEMDPRILTNKHPVYESAGFTQLNAYYKEEFGAKKDLKDLYRFVGNNFFVTADLIKNRDGSHMKVDREVAEEFCEIIAGRLLSTEELKAYLAGRYLTIENFIWPVSLRRNEPEWTGTKIAWDNYFVYLKDSPNPVRDEVPTVNKFVEADEDDYRFAFRCGFHENIFTPAK